MPAACLWAGVGWDSPHAVPSCHGLPRPCNVLFIKQEHLDVFERGKKSKVVSGQNLTN